MAASRSPSVGRLLPADPKKKYAVCLDGKNACPPEDCGGIWGYYELLKAVKNPKRRETSEDRLRQAGEP
jgi:hypothetical protein